MTWEITPYTIQRDVARAIAAASAGSKVLAGYGVIQTAFGPTCTFKLIRNGVTVFQVETTVPITGPQGLSIPPGYEGAATVLSAADIDTGTWYIQIERGSNIARNRIGRTGQPFELTDDLDTAFAVLVGWNYLTLPSTLDVGAPVPAPTPTPAPAPTPTPVPVVDGVVTSIDYYVNQMTVGNTGSSRFTGGWTTTSGEIICPTRNAIVSMTNPPYQGDMMAFNGGPDVITPWVWLDQESTSVMGNATIEVGGVEVLGRHKSSGEWSSFFGIRQLGMASRWNSSGNTLTYEGAKWRSFGTSIPGDSYATHGLEFWPDGFTPQYRHPGGNVTWVANQDALHVRFSCRRIRINTNGDSRTAFHPRVKIGFDFHNSHHPNMPGTASSGASPYGRPEQGTWVGYAMDGGQCSWHVVPFNPANPDLWYSYAVTTIGPQSYPYAGWRPLWAAVAGKTAYSQYFPWSAPSWTLTHSQFRANPPPLPRPPVTF